MMAPFNTDLMKHPPAALTAPTAHERAALRAIRAARRAARRAAFLAFVAAVFAQPPRHPVAKVRGRIDAPSGP
ncbi:hypothetical protein [Defluviimonas sp. WL0075]|uniref:Uncharacterized protein n=1 Tax=Albidovulum sediminicola TaxID=2984331 RepID=A0ABT2Z6A4_9RHOB|nr:hypothetical protein [Defluviimonas sp. WL0075]MCV2866664.1 hypothetical protein [Defluviimonas sp. WL0075]